MVIFHIFHCFKLFFVKKSGASLAEFAVVTAMMATFVGTSVPKFSDIMEYSKERKTMDELGKIAVQAMNFYNQTNESEGRGRFPGQDKYNKGVGGYRDLDSLVSELELFDSGNNTEFSPKWVSIFGIDNPKAPIPSGADFINDTILESNNCSNCSKNRFPGHEEWIKLFSNETLISPYQDGHYIYVVIPGYGSGIDVKSPILFIADAENPARLYKIVHI